jgi:hypothetical protein
VRALLFPLHTLSTFTSKSFPTSTIPLQSEISGCGVGSARFQDACASARQEDLPSLHLSLHPHSSSSPFTATYFTHCAAMRSLAGVPHTRPCHKHSKHFRQPFPKQEPAASSADGALFSRATFTLPAPREALNGPHKDRGALKATAGSPPDQFAPSQLRAEADAVCMDVLMTCHCCFLRLMFLFPFTSEKMHWLGKS